MDGFSVIIPTRYTSGALKFCYETLKKHSRLDHEYIIVCDMYTSWQTYKWLQENEIMYYENNACNWYMNMNFGATKATREYLAFFQDDLLVSEGWDINIAKYLDHKKLITPTYLQSFEIGTVFGLNNDQFNSDINDFDFKEFDQYCKEHSREDLTPDCFGFFPEVIAKDTFERLGGYTIWTKEERRHIHHEDFLKWRLTQIGGSYFHAKDAFAYHFPNVCRDRVPMYGWVINQGIAHYPLICKKCGIKYMGIDLSEEEFIGAGYLGYYICKNCR